MQSVQRATFREILEATRSAAAESAWSRAKTFSGLRHLAQSQKRRRSAVVAARGKITAIQHAISLAPSEIRVTLDCDYQVGLLSIRWQGRGRLHLPAGTELPTSRATSSAVTTRA